MFVASSYFNMRKFVVVLLLSYSSSKNLLSNDSIAKQQYLCNVYLRI